MNDRVTLDQRLTFFIKSLVSVSAYSKCITDKTFTCITKYITVYQLIHLYVVF